VVKPSIATMSAIMMTTVVLQKKTVKENEEFEYTYFSTTYRTLGNKHICPKCKMG
jgi:hypothetical protein